MAPAGGTSEPRRSPLHIAVYAETAYGDWMRAALAAVASLILLAAPAAIAAPELPISSVARQAAALSQLGPQIATDGTHFLVVWHDTRLAPTRPPVWVTRLGSDGAPLAPGPLSLPGSAEEIAGRALVTWTGSVYLVMWTNWGDREVLWVRVDRDGRVLDAQPHVIDDVTTPHSVVSLNGRTLLLFTGEWPETRLYGQLLEGHGTAVGRRILFPSTGRSDWAPRVASNGENFYVVWSRLMPGRVDFVGVPVSFDGVPGTEKVLGDGTYGGLLASNGATYLAAHRGGGTVITDHLDATGATLLRTVHPASAPDPLVALASRGSGYVLVTRQPTYVEARELDEAGRPTGALPLDANSTDSISMTLASHASATIAVWHEDLDHVASDSDVFAEVVDPQGDRRLLSESAPRQEGIRIASSGSEALAAWVEHRTARELRVARVNATGVPVDGEGTLIDTDVTQPPAITFDGINYVLAWSTGTEDGRDCASWAIRVTLSGQPIGRPTLLTRVCTAALGLASNGQHSLLVRNAFEADPGTGGTRRVLEASRLQRDLTIDATAKLPSEGLRGIDIEIAWNTDTWLVTWTQFYSSDDCGLCDPPPPPRFNVHAARLSASLHLLDAEPLRLASSDDDRAPTVAAVGDGFFVAWEHRPDGTIRGRTVSRFGVAFAESERLLGRGPALVVHEGAVILAFEEDGNLVYEPPDRPLSLNVIAHSADREHSARLASVGGSLIAVYLRTASEAQYGFVDRGFVRKLDAQPRRRGVRK